MNILSPGQMLGAYRIINQIGQGGMATVYKAYQASMDRNVALKVLPSHLANSKEFAGRFQQEARIIANLEHPHILPVFDSGESDGISYLVMRYLEAGTLQEKIESRPLSWNEIDRIFTQLAEALNYAHDRGVIHRDLKPSNALIDSQGNLFLTDFGIAKLLEGTSHFTKTDTVMGTPAYISPEQAQGQVVDRRSDIYSLGIILYEMVTGRVPFMADTPLAVILKHVSAPIPLPSTIRADIPPLIEQVILKALAKDPQDRFNTTEEFIAVWKRALSTNESVSVATSNYTKTMPYSSVSGAARSEVTPQMGKSKKASRGWLVGCLAGVCLLSGIGAVSFFVINGLDLPSIDSSEEYFEIAIGNEIANGEPAEGAGVIEEPGSKDIYAFTAEPGETIYVHLIEYPEIDAEIGITMMDDAGLNVFESCLQCGDPGLITLERGGEYTIIIGNEDPDGAGNGEYRFKLWEAPSSEEFSISLDEEVSRDTPGAGAGFIESPGARDIYTFTADEGQDVYFQVKEEPATDDAIYWRGEDQAGNALFESCLQCGDPGLIVLVNGGVYTITVGGSSHGTGAYAIQVWGVYQFDEFEIQIGDTISQDNPGPGAGIIEVPGAYDIYSFTATAGQTVALTVIESPDSGNLIYWRLEDGEENEFFEDCMGCGDPEPFTFEEAGIYKIIVGSDTSSGTGAYEFQISAP